MKKNSCTYFLTITGIFIFSFVNYSSLFAQPGTLDLHFGDSGQVSFRGKSAITFYATQVQSNGRIVAAGGSNDLIIVRFKANGSVDSSFGKNGFVDTSLGHYYTIGRDMAIQNDGKIVVAGYIKTSDLDTSSCFVVRYLKTGEIDKSFGNNGAVVLKHKNSFYSEFTRVVIQSNNKIVCAGDGLGNQTTNFIFYRFNKNGTIDSSFGNNGFTIVNFPTPAYLSDLILQLDDKLVGVGSAMYTVRLTKNGHLDNSFGNNGKIIDPSLSVSLPFSVVKQSSGRLVIAGIYQSDEIFFRGYTSAGIIDSSFGVNGDKIIAGTPLITHKLCVQNDDKIIAGSTVNNKFGMFRIMPNGDIDSSFGDNGFVKVKNTTSAIAFDVKLQADNKILLCGNKGIFGFLCRFENDSITPFAILNKQHGEKQEFSLATY